MRGAIGSGCTVSGSSDVVWYIERDNQRFGPFSTEDFRRFEREGQLVPTDIVWHTGLDDWITYGDYRTSQRSRTSVASPGVGVATATAGEVAAGSPRSALRPLLRKALRFPTDMMATAIAIVRRPTEFGQSRIDTGPRGLGRAVYFYMNMFVLVFVIDSSLTYLDFYTGASQPRELAWLSIQIALAVPFLYLLNAIARQRVRVSGVAQSVLYADALFLVSLSFVAPLLSYLMFSQSSSQREIDILATELEQCLAGESILYWLLRGDLQFFMYLPSTKSAEYLELARDYLQYALAIPFCVVFAKLLHGRYAAPILLNTVFGIIAFSLVVPGFNYGRQEIRAAIVRNSACGDQVAQRASQKYNQSLLAKQIVARTNVQMGRASGTYGIWVSLIDGRLAMAVQVRPGVTDAAGAVTKIARGVRSLYCESNTNLRYARMLGMPLLLVVRDNADRILLREEINAGACQSGATIR
jgi:hypothetical protein